MNVYMINVANPDVIEKLLSPALGNHKVHPYHYVRNWLKQGLLLSIGNKWFQRRKMLTKAFHFNILQKYFEIFVEETSFFMKRVEEEVGKEKTDLFPMMNSTTLRIMCETTMGVTNEDITSLVNPYLASLDIIGDCFTTRLGRVWLHPDSIYQLTNYAKTEKIAVKNLQTLTNTVIKKRRDYLAEMNFNHFDYDDNVESKGNLAMLDLLLKNEKSGVLNSQDVREEVDSFMFAGHDTTAVAMTFMMMALANEPEIQEKIHAEICQVLGDSDRSLTTEDLSQMKYLECCIKETLRLYPSAPLIARTLRNETVLGNYTVPANTTAFIFIYDLHRRPNLYPDPERFIPERFLPENCANRHPYAYIPFSGGPRNCIGQKFAMLEMKTVISHILRRFRLKPITKPEDIVYKTDLVLRSVHPIYVKFCAR
ncbi:cytochrome P450 4c3-like [Melitaea cinxia]|uniref:cytochrome P450 4c3-like n=1 Tax=Melitaea cinxia TaxID=113334 RepID=UPI001E270DD3|nr:cytochrome P450 4c3-like [Melitaea cinxia]